MRIENDKKLDFNNVLFRPKRSNLGSRKEVKLERHYELNKPNKGWFNGIPIMASNMDGVGTMEMADTLLEHKMFTCLVKTYTTQELVEYFDIDINPVSYSTDKELPIGARQGYVAMSIGPSDREVKKFFDVMELSNGGVQYLCIDVANGYQDRFAECIQQIRNNFKDLIIIAGNVVTADMTQELIMKGANIVKVGIGPGSVCTTRIQTGVGYPQLSAIIECADAAHGLGGFIIADGGCTSPGDVAKAFGGGADFVMLGGMLAGHVQGGGNIITKLYHTNEVDHEGIVITEAKDFVHFYGMSSDAANKKHFGGLKDYRSSEGREVLIPYKGDVSSTIQDILGGLRSTCTYIGAPGLKQLSKCTTFVRCYDTHNRVYE